MRLKLGLTKGRLWDVMGAEGKKACAAYCTRGKRAATLGIEIRGRVQGGRSSIEKRLPHLKKEKELTILLQGTEGSVVDGRGKKGRAVFRPLSGKIKTRGAFKGERFFCGGGLPLSKKTRGECRR